MAAFLAKVAQQQFGIYEGSGKEQNHLHQTNENYPHLNKHHLDPEW